MSELTEDARAKVNLTLEIVGRRTDGYHDLISLVAFAASSDRVFLDPGRGSTLDIDGPFAHSLDGPNLIVRACELVRSVAPAAQLGAFHLMKRLPVAAGLGGGSADAAAALRLIARANPHLQLDFAELAARLGADVPACLRSKPLWMAGTGTLIRPIACFPKLASVLVNPGMSLATAQVFRTLAAPALAEGEAEARLGACTDTIPDSAALLALCRASRNDLEPPAKRLLPVIGDVLAALADTDGCQLARMSGSGPTCFGLYDTCEAAHAAAIALRAAHPDWWIEPTVLLSSP
jgi:4-diphosphocytidyl-2-C-methyl-D-erythritol kinase